MPGKRTQDATFETLTYLTYSELITEKQKIIFVINQYEDDSEVEQEIAMLTD